MKTVTPQILLSFLVILALEVEGDYKDDKRKELIRTLRRQANRWESPDGKTVVNINAFKLDRVNVDENAHTVVLYFYLSMDWKDDRLQWSPENYRGIDEVSIKQYRVWKPEMINENATANWRKELWSYESLVVSSSGLVKHVPLFRPEFHCAMDIKYWPHDTHNCSFRVRSWHHASHELDFNIKDPLDISLSTMTSSSEASVTENSWVISNFGITKGINHYACCPDPLVDLNFSFLLTRNAPALNWTVKVPMAGVSVIALLIFVMPPESTMKFSYGIFCTFTMTYLLAGLRYLFHSTTTQLPLIADFAGQQIILYVLYLIISSLVVRTNTSPHSSGLPPFLKEPVFILSQHLLLGNYLDEARGISKAKSWTLHNDQEGLTNEAPEVCEWRLLGAVVDRLAFLLAITIWVISFLRFSYVF